MVKVELNEKKHISFSAQRQPHRTAQQWLVAVINLDAKTPEHFA